MIDAVGSGLWILNNRPSVGLMNGKQHMNARKQQLPALIFACFLVGPLAWQTALAQTNPTASDDLEVQVEFAAGLSLSCTTLNFGEVVVELGDRGGANVLLVDPEEANSPFFQFTGSDGNASFVPDSAERATCDVTGYSPETDVVMLVTRADNAAIGMTPRAGGGVSEGLTGLQFILRLSSDGATGTSPLGTARTTIYDGITPSDGSPIQFYFGGELTIPNNAEAKHMGAYEADVTITVEEDERET